MKIFKVFFLFFSSCISIATIQVNAQATDSIAVELKQVNVTSTRATKTTPMAFTNISKEELQQSNNAKDIPTLLQLTPSVTITSDAGTGIGYTSLRVRGTDPTRINITTNGVPMNDAESGLTYFSNTPDFVSNVQDVQIQRGVGTSTNGAGAFGASINMRTDDFLSKPWGRMALSYGSYNTNKESLQGGSGFFSVDKSHSTKAAIEGRLSYVGSNGYIDRAYARMPSMFVQAGVFNNRSSLKFITFCGGEETYHAWDYTSRQQQKLYGRTYNPSGLYLTDEGDTAFYNNQIDFYRQQHYQLHATHIFSSALKLNISLHYTHGSGYYEQYKRNQNLDDYDLLDKIVLKNEELGSIYSDLIRRKNEKNDFYGIISSILYKRNSIENILGAGWNKFYGRHYGDVMWVRDYDDLSKEKYYNNTAHKYDFNIYNKITWNFARSLFLYADLQYRRVIYNLEGLTIDRIKNNWDFFNPKVGLTWNINNYNKVYSSFAVAHKEPTRNDYENALADTSLPMPIAERLNDWELGYSLSSKTLSCSANLYYMHYDNQFVLTGAQDDNGEFVASNVKNSYRMGIELAASWQIIKELQLNMNYTLSRNRAEQVHLSYSPSNIASGRLTYYRSNWKATLSGVFVGKQYMTNSNNEDHLLDSYFVCDFDISKDFRIYDSKINVGMAIYNLMNNEYDSNGSAGDGWAVYSCQAKRHCLFYISVDL